MEQPLETLELTPQTVYQLRLIRHSICVNATRTRSVIVDTLYMEQENEDRCPTTVVDALTDLIGDGDTYDSEQDCLESSWDWSKAWLSQHSSCT